MGYKSADGLLKVTKGFLIANLVASGISMILAVQFYGLLAQIEAETATEAAILTHDSLYVMIWWLILASFIGTAIAYLMWLHRTNANLRAIGVTSLEFTPGWAVGSWFIPIVNLVRGYTTLTDVWKGSHARIEGMHIPSVPALFGVWWAAYLLSGFVDRLTAMGLNSPDPAISDFRTANTGEIISAALTIVAGVILLKLVTDVTEATARKKVEMAKMNRPAGQPPFQPPSLGEV